MNLNLARFLAIPVVLFGLVAKSHAGGAAPVIQIDDSDPSHVIITTTGAFASQTPPVTLTEAYGIDLADFFTAAVIATTNSAQSSSLTPSGPGTVVYDSYASDNLDGSLVNLNLFAAGSSINQVFNPSTQAFTGTMILNLSSLAAYLPSVGSGSAVFTGNSSASSWAVGGWEVVSAAPTPEPATCALFSLAGGALLGLRKRR